MSRRPVQASQPLFMIKFFAVFSIPKIPPIGFRSPHKGIENI